MEILIDDAVGATMVFAAIFIASALLSVHRKTSEELFSSELTQELKGLSILAVLFSHIGYFLVSDHRFLFPFSIMAGVGVNIFLFLSGFGLTVSTLKKKESLARTYIQRLLKLFIPLWLVIIFFTAADYLMLNREYSWEYLGHAFAGFFPRADLWKNLNSPFWFFTFILFYYLIFPILYKVNRWLAVPALYFAMRHIVLSAPESLKDVLRLYEVHILAFPFGVLVGNLHCSPAIRHAILRILDWIRAAILKFFGDGRIQLFKLSHLALIAGLAGLIAYTAYHSGVGQDEWKEETTSIITMTAILAVFLAKKVEIRLLYLFGLYSYEIYLLHWPIMSRYDFLYKNTPAWLATVLYIGLFIFAGMALKKISSFIFRKVFLPDKKSCQQG